MNISTNVNELGTDYERQAFAMESDPLSAYLKQISAYPLLSKEDEYLYKCE